MIFSETIKSFVLVLLVASLKSINCGKLKIVGGVPAQSGQAPFIGAYFSNGDFVCSCSLISPAIAITAAHCTFFFPNNIWLRFGSLLRNTDGITVNVTRFIQNPAFSIKTFDNDISLLRLGIPTRQTRSVFRIRLPSSEKDVLNAGDRVTISGWGLQSYDDMNEPPLTLMTTTVFVSNFGSCSRNYSQISQPLSERMFCAGAKGVDACLGDSGGPLVFNNTLYGIVSFGYGCAMDNYPGIYTKVSALLPWINKTIQLLL